MTKRVVLWAIVAAIVATGCNASRPPDRGAYDVVKHYTVPCAGRGGFGEYIIVNSHRQADLEPALRRWYATNRRDLSRCLFLFAFSSTTSKEAFEHEVFGDPITYSQKERRGTTPGLFYYNHADTHDEAWIGPDGRLHKGAPDSI